MMIEPGLLVAAQPSRAAPALGSQQVGLQIFFDRSGDQLAELRDGQRGGPDFFPAASPDSGTTRPAATNFDDDARPSSSAPDSRPSPPPPWPAPGILQCDEPLWSRGPAPSAAPPHRSSTGNDHV